MRVKSTIKSVFFVPKHKTTYGAKQKMSEKLDFEVILNRNRIFVRDFWALIINFEKNILFYDRILYI